MLIDAKARQQAIDPNHSFIVQAPAGSGKTELLTQRYLALLGRVDNPEHIVAITFTRKAAAEMRGRIVGALASATQPEPAEDHKKLTWQLAKKAFDQDQAKSWQLLENPARLRIQTIDAFTHGLVHQMPLSADLPTQPVASDDAGDLYRQAARRTLQWLEDDNEWAAQIATLLTHFGNQRSRVEAMLAQMLACRDSWLRHLPLGRGDDHAATFERFRQELEACLQGAVENQLQTLQAAMPPGWRSQLLPLAEFAMKTLGEQSELVAALAENWPAEAQHLHAWQWLYGLLFTDKGEPRKTVTVKQGFPKSDEKTAIIEWINGNCYDESLQLAWRKLNDLPPSKYDDAQWQVMLSLFQVLPIALAELRLVFQAENQVDHSEISQAALNSLGDEDAPSDLMLRLDYAIQHLLIDEFQDTSLMQYRLFNRLISGWEAGDGRTFFVVGDPMQSIYRFRDADVGLFLKAWQQGMENLPLTALQLQANFRSDQTIVDWNNDAYRVVMPGAHNINAGAVAFSASHAAKGQGEHSGIFVHPQSNSVEQEAEQVADLIECELASNKDSTIAVLVRSRTHVHGIIQALRQRDIAFQGQDIEGLAGRMVISDLFSLTRALIQPNDGLAWLALLRAPWLGLSLAEITALIHPEQGSNVFRQLKTAWADAQIAPALGERFQAVMQTLQDAMYNKGRWPLSQWVRRTWYGLDGPAALQQASDLDDAEQFFALLDDVDEGGDLSSLRLLQERIAKLYAQPNSESDGRVQIMTIHKSKGLEFDCVIVPGLGKKGGRNDTQLLGWIEQQQAHGEAVYLSVPHGDGQERDPLYKFIQSLDKERSDNELRRVLYVATTRAISRLHLLGHAPTNKDNQCKPQAGSFLAMLWPLVKTPFESAAQSQEQSENEWQTLVDPFYWRLPDNYQTLTFSDDLKALNAVNAELEVTEFDWAGELARNVGSVVHRALQNMAESQRLAMPSEDWVINALMREGVPRGDWPAGLERVQQAIANSLHDETGQWLMAAHPHAQSEMALSGVYGEQVVNLVVDRTFVDESGQRWVVDYKTSTHEGSDIDEFLASEKDRYQFQLERYGHMLKRLDDRPVMLMLYFPMLKRHIKWQLPDFG